MGIKKRRLSLQKIVLLVFVFIFFLPGTAAFAQTAYSNTKYDAMSYMLMDLNSGKVLVQHDTARQVFPASTTKLMTALLLMEKKGLDGTTTVGTEINGLPSGSSLMHISVGEKISVKDLFYGLMLCSGNDAACTIGAYVSGSVDQFVALMNQRAAELGMTNTHFVSPYGAFLNQDETAPIPEDQLGIHHYTTVDDMAKLTLAAAKHPEILNAGNTGTYTLTATNKHQEERVIENSNPLVHNLKNHPEFDQFYYKDATGLKTGTVSNIVVGDKTIRTYGNVVATASRNGVSLAALIFDDESENDSLQSYKRWQLAADLFEYGFNNFSMADLTPYIQAVSLTRPVQAQSGSSGGDFEISSKSSASTVKVLMDSTEAQNLKSGTVQLVKQIKLDDSLAPSVQTGDTVGSVQYTLDGANVYQCDLVVTGREQAVASATDGKDAAAAQADKPGSNGMGWLLWVLIPVCAAGALFMIRKINMDRRRRKRKRRYQGLGAETRRKL